MTQEELKEKIKTLIEKKKATEEVKKKEAIERLRKMLEERKKTS